MSTMILYQSLIFFIFNYLVLFIYYNYFLVRSPSVGHMGKVPLFSLNPSLSPSVVCWGYPQPTKKKKKKKMRSKRDVLPILCPNYFCFFCWRTESSYSRHIMFILFHLYRHFMSLNELSLLPTISNLRGWCI